MPPRHAYWTIVVGESPTAFRARDREELVPTFERLRAKEPLAVLRWFERGRLWLSPEEAQGGRPVESRERRGPEWRPGGSHRDPRDRFKKDKKSAGGQARETRRPAGGDRSERPEGRPWTPKPPASRGDRPWTPSKPAGSKGGGPAGQRREPWAGKPSGSAAHRDAKPPRDRRPWTPKASDTRPSRPWTPKPSGPPGRAPKDQGRRPWSPKPSGDRPPAPPTGDRPWKPKPAGGRPWKPRPEGGDRQRGTGDEGRRPWTPKPPGNRPWTPNPAGDRPWKPRSEGDQSRAGRDEGRRPWTPKPAGDRPWKPKPPGGRSWKPLPEGQREGPKEQPRGPWKPKSAAYPPRGSNDARPKPDRDRDSGRPENTDRTPREERGRKGGTRLVKKVRR